MRVFGLRGSRRLYALISVPCRLSNAAMRALTAKTLATWVSSSDRISSGIVRASTVQWSMASKRTPALRHSSTVRWAQPASWPGPPQRPGAWAGWAAPVSRSSLPSTVPKCFTARRFAQPGQRILRCQVQLHRLADKVRVLPCQAAVLPLQFLSCQIRILHTFPLLFYLHRLLYTWEWCM